MILDGPTPLFIMYFSTESFLNQSIGGATWHDDNVLFDLSCQLHPFFSARPLDS